MADGHSVTGEDTAMSARDRIQRLQSQPLFTHSLPDRGKDRLQIGRPKVKRVALHRRMEPPTQQTVKGSVSRARRDASDRQIAAHLGLVLVGAAAERHRRFDPLYCAIRTRQRTAVVGLPEQISGRAYHGPVLWTNPPTAERSTEWKI
jgi:hypothetical protein